MLLEPSGIPKNGALCYIGPKSAMLGMLCIHVYVPGFIRFFQEPK